MASHTLGLKSIQSIAEILEEYSERHVQNCDWFLEILEDTKRLFGSSVLEFLPKTPAAKRKRKPRLAKDDASVNEDVFVDQNSKLSINKDSSDDSILACTPPKRTYRTRAASRSTTVKPKSKPTRKRNANSKTSDSCAEKENVSMNILLPKQKALCDAVKSPNTPNLTQSKAAGKGHVKHKVNAFEDLIEANSPQKTPENALKNKQIHDRIPETPENSQLSTATPDTVCRIQTPLVEEKTPTAVVEETPNSTPKLHHTPHRPSDGHRRSSRSRQSLRRSMRKSLKSLKTPLTCKMLAHNRLKLKKKEECDVTHDEVVKDLETASSKTDDSTPDVNKVETTEDTMKRESNEHKSQNSVEKDESPKRQSKRISKSENCDIASAPPETMDTEQYSDEECEDEVMLISDNENSEEHDSESNELLPRDNEEEQKSEEKNEKNSSSASSESIDYEKENFNPVASSVQIKQRKETVTSASEEEETVRPTRTKTRTKQRKNVASVSSSDEEPVLPVRASTRTKQRKETVTSSEDGEIIAKPVRASTRTKQRKETAASSVSSEAGDEVVKPVRSSTRTKQRKETAASSISSDGEEEVKTVRSSTRTKQRKETTTSDNEDPFAMPEAPPTRMTRTKTRKRQLDEDEDDASDVSLSKKSCTAANNLTQEMHSEDMSTDDEQCETSHSKYTPMNSTRTFTSFKHNLSNKVVTPANMAPGVVKSFIKRNTPPPKMTDKEQLERRKREFLEKQKKDQQRIQQRDANLKMRIEEQRRKREERMRKAAESRTQLEKQDMLQKTLNKKKMEEKLQQQNERLKEEQLREEKMKQKIRMKKLQEIEDKKKQEEEERLKKLKEQEEESRRNFELLQKKREAELEERQRRLQEEMRQKEEKMAELELARQAEKERVKRQFEEERQKEKDREIQRQRQKEERERAIARAQSEKEKHEQERKKQRDLQMKKAEEIRAKRFKLEEEQREKQKKEEQEIQNMIKQHNAQLAVAYQNLVNKNAALVASQNKQNLNTTQTVSSSNPNSYEMTPVRKHKPASADNYDISELRSDDDTDDEDDPRKKIPAWATGPNLKALLISQHYRPTEFEKLFEAIQPLDLNEIFEKKRARFNKRTSSAQWDSPILPPGKSYAT